MTAVQMVLAFGGPQLGEVESGLLAALMGVSLTIFTGGMITLLIVGWVAWRYPELRTYIKMNEQLLYPEASQDASGSQLLR